MASEDPDLITATALKKVADFSPSDKWAGEHPITAAALEIGKPVIMQKLAEFMGVSAEQGPRRGTVPPRRQISSPYGK